jgi:hypothetical protein
MPAGSTYSTIATTTLGSAAPSYTFSSIPSTYTDLVLIVNGSASSTAFNAYIRFNSDTGSNYSITTLLGTGTAAQSGRQTSATFIGIDSQAAWRSGNRTQNRVNIMNYANTTTNKTVLTRADAPADATDAIVGLWRNTAAITSILVAAGGVDFATGTTFTLYGIAAA